MRRTAAPGELALYPRTFRGSWAPPGALNEGDALSILRQNAAWVDFGAHVRQAPLVDLARSLLQKSFEVLKTEGTPLSLAQFSELDGDPFDRADQAAHMMLQTLSALGPLASARCRSAANVAHAAFCLLALFDAPETLPPEHFAVAGFVLGQADVMMQAIESEIAANAARDGAAQRGRAKAKEVSAKGALHADVQATCAAYDADKAEHQARGKKLSMRKFYDGARAAALNGGAGWDNRTLQRHLQKGGRTKPKKRNVKPKG